MPEESSRPNYPPLPSTLKPELQNEFNAAFKGFHADLHGDTLQALKLIEDLSARLDKMEVLQTDALPAQDAMRDLMSYCKRLETQNQELSGSYQKLQSDIETMRAEMERLQAQPNTQPPTEELETRLAELKEALEKRASTIEERLARTLQMSSGTLQTMTDATSMLGEWKNAVTASLTPPLLKGGTSQYHFILNFYELFVERWEEICGKLDDNTLDDSTYNQLQEMKRLNPRTQLLGDRPESAVTRGEKHLIRIIETLHRERCEYLAPILS